MKKEGEMAPVGDGQIMVVYLIARNGIGLDALLSHGESIRSSSEP